MDLFTRVVEEVGCAVIGPTLDLAPADRKLFFVRDVTATVESVPLITGSIVSKKLAVAPRGLMITVGSGSGRLYADDRRRPPARGLHGGGCGAGRRAERHAAYRSRLVLGPPSAMRLRVQETVDFLLGRHRDRRVLDLVLSVVAEMAAHGGRRA